MFDLFNYKFRFLATVSIALLQSFLGLAPAVGAQQKSDAEVIEGIDASVAARMDTLLSYTVTEHYAVYRNQDTEHPAAEMTVKTTYRREVGKSYEILSESGSALMRKEVLDRILETERVATRPANRSQAVLTSANYAMTVEGNETAGGRSCIRLAIAPRRESASLFKGRLWVDAQDLGIVKMEGEAAKSNSIATGPAKVSREYAMRNGLPMATHATATVSSWLLGPTTIVIEYSGYKMEVGGGPK